MQSVTSNAVYNEVKSRLLVNLVTGQSISDGATSMTDAEFFTKVMQKTGTPVFLWFGYAWASDCLISFYDGSTLKGKINANGCAMMLIVGSFGVGSWNALTYVVFGGFNNTGTKNNAIVSGSLSYNGGSILIRHCNFI